MGVPVQAPLRRELDRDSRVLLRNGHVTGLRGNMPLGDAEILLLFARNRGYLR